MATLMGINQLLEARVSKLITSLFSVIIKFIMSKLSGETLGKEITYTHKHKQTNKQK
jgi:hypothetical protein